MYDTASKHFLINPRFGEIIISYMLFTTLLGLQICRNYSFYLDSFSKHNFNASFCIHYFPYFFNG